MKYVIDKSQNIPAYLQLYKQVRDDIVKEIYPYNSKLPSKRTIAEEVGLSTVTVEHSYGLLIEEGYIESRERSGYFVIFRTGDGFVASSKGENKHIFPINHHTET
ncbi:MAG: GntR family transcriptional regulator, partial [Ruminococcus sp.]